MGRKTYSQTLKQKDHKSLGQNTKPCSRKYKAYRKARFLVFHTHISRSETHSFDSFIQGHTIYSITCHGELGSRNSLDS